MGLAKLDALFHSVMAGNVTKEIAILVDVTEEIVGKKVVRILGVMEEIVRMMAPHLMDVFPTHAMEPRHHPLHLDLALHPDQLRRHVMTMD